MNPYNTETKTIKGCTVTVSMYYDHDMGAPWKEHDCHGDVREVRSIEDKKPGERVLHTSGRDIYLYDFAGAIARAKSEGWGIRESELATLTRNLGRTPTRGEIVERAVLKDMEYLRDWLDNDWHWVGYTTEIVTPDGEEHDGESVWGYDDEDYMLGEAWGNAERTVDELLEAITETELATCWP